MWTCTSVLRLERFCTRFCLPEYPWTVLDPTVNMVSRVDDLTTAQRCPFSKRGHDGALDLVCLQER